MNAHTLTVEPATAHLELIKDISSGGDLNAQRTRLLATSVEHFLKEPQADKIGIHREIGKAIFARSDALYCGEGLPDHLRRYTYPPLLAILLNTHCNAACFFCREADYKGTSVEFEKLAVLEGAVRNARVVDLTGWGEPFLYPEFERTVEWVLSINQSPQLIQVTTNGSLLSKRWGRLLSGKVNKLIVSINAGTAKTYNEQMRFKTKQHTFDRLLSNLRECFGMLTDEDKKRLDLHMVANRDNFREISQLVHLAVYLGVPVVSIGNYICAQKQHMDKTLWNVKQEYNDELDRARELGASLGVQVHGRRFFVEETAIKGATNCMAPFEQLFVETTGKTAPCCFMGQQRVGLVYDDGFEAVWFSSLMNKLRHDRFLPPCQVCTVFTPFDSKTAHISATLLTEKAQHAVT